MKKIKVAHIIYGLKRAGAEGVLLSLATGMPGERFEPLVVTFTAGGALEESFRAAGVRVVHIPKRRRYDLSVLARLVRFLRRERVDVVHTHLFTADSWGRVAAAAARVPFVVSSLQSVDLWLTPLQLRVEKWTSLFADRLIAVSPAVKEFYVSHVGVPGAKITVVYNGVDCSRLPAAVPREKKRRELGLRNDSLLVGVAARLEEQKDLSTWLHAARIASDRKNDIEFAIAGEGSQRSALEQLAGRLGLEGRVHFLGLRRDVHEIIALCDVMAFSSRFEGLSLALLESMASARAVVTTRIGGNTEVVRHGENGLLVEPGDAAALAEAELALLSDAQMRRRLGDAAQSTARERFSVEGMIRSTVRLYEEGLAERRVK